jgi:hypothetical protein
VDAGCHPPVILQHTVRIEKNDFIIQNQGLEGTPLHEHAESGGKQSPRQSVAVEPGVDVGKIARKRFILELIRVFRPKKMPAIFDDVVQNEKAIRFLQEANFFGLNGEYSVVSLKE